MNISSARFSLTETEKARVQTFKDDLWFNSELCNHCFTRVREIDRNPAAERLSSTSLKNTPADFYERTESGTQEHCGWDHNPRFGTCFCLDCGGDLTASHYEIDIEQMLEFGENLCRYVRDHTALSIDGNQFARELGRLKRQPWAQARESQIFAVAFARALQTQTASSMPTTQPAD